MNLRFLETFVWLARLKNFRMTAERMHTTQAGISSRIATLEEEFGVRLFDRGSREVTLTLEGAQVLTYAERILKLAHEMKQDISDPQKLKGNIRIGAIESVVHSWLPTFMSRMNEAYPYLSIEISSDTTTRLCESLVNGGLDLALQTASVTAPSISNLALGSFPMRWVANPSFQLGGDALTTLDFAAYRILSFPRDSAPHQTIVKIFDGLGTDDVNINCISTIAAIIRLAIDGFGVAVLPPAVIQHELARGDLGLLKVIDTFPPLHLVASYRTSPENPLYESVAKLAHRVMSEFAITSGGDIAISA